MIMTQHMNDKKFKRPMQATPETFQTKDVLFFPLGLGHIKFTVDTVIYIL